MVDLSAPIEQPRVFISYARSDGETFATDLRNRLEKEHIPLWQDRLKLEGGRDWWLQIVAALNKVEFMVLVMTPAALKSPTVRREWHIARQQGVCVYPVRVHPDLDIESLPRWMRDVHWYDLDHEWSHFLGDLHRTCQQPRVPFMAEDMAADFVQRPTELNALMNKLLDEKHEEPIAITAALRGAGGYGKTTIARAICHDERIQEAFDDGILWVTLGENPGPDKIIGLFSDLIYMLSHEKLTFTGLDTAMARFAELLSDRDILLVIDDVWNAAHLKPFLQGGKRCARLITTRDERVVPPGAARINVDAMQQSEAIYLLTTGIKRKKYYAYEIKALKQLVKRLGEWPLLLKLVNGVLRARVETHQSLSSALAFVNEAFDEGGLLVFDDTSSQDRNHAVATTLEISLKLLNVDEQMHYHELSIFPEDIDIPLEVLQRIWAWSKFKTEWLCERLFKLSLLLNFDPVKRTIRLHDVVRTYLRQEVGPELSLYNQKLLDSYGLKRWANLSPAEPYLWDYLAAHLSEAGHIEELITTLKDGCYLATKMHLRPVHTVEADLLLALKQAPTDNVLSLLARTIAKISYLFARCKTPYEIDCVLHSRLSSVPELSPVSDLLEKRLVTPFLTSWHPLPDLSQDQLIRALVGHEDWVRGCAISPDGDWVVSASDDKTLRVWDAQTGEERLRLQGHEGNVNECMVSPDGDWIVSASTDKTLRVWDAQTGEERLRLLGHEGGVNSCAISPDGKWIVSGSDDISLRVWDTQTGEERLRLLGHEDWVRRCAISPDGSWIVSASDDRMLRVWDAQTGEERLHLQRHESGVNDCAVSPDGKWIVSASTDKTLRVWGAQTGEERLRLLGHKGSVNSCAVSPDGNWIVSASDDETLRVWDAQTGEERLCLQGHEDEVRDCAISPDGNWIVSASEDKTLRIWDARIRSRPVRLQGHEDEVRDCAVSPDGDWSVSASADETLRIWDTQTGEERISLRGHEAGVRGCAISPDGDWIVSASVDKTLRIWDVYTSEKILRLDGHEDWVNKCAVSPDGDWVVSASVDETLRVWDVQTGTENLCLQGHTDWVNDCVVSPDGNWIVSASDDKTLRIWNLWTGEECLCLQGHEDSVNACVVSPDGNWIVSASDDKTLRVWNLWTGEEDIRLQGHEGRVRGCAVSPDGRWIVSVSVDETLRLWDAQTGKCLAILHVDDELYTCTFCPDSEHIVASGTHGLYFLRVLNPVAQQP